MSDAEPCPERQAFALLSVDNDKRLLVMLFNSYEFLFFFLPITLAGYFLLNRQRLTIAANSWLLFASLFFYGWWNIVYLPLILGSILFNYTIGNLLIDTDYLKKRVITKKGIFVFGITVNVLFLCY